VVPVLLSGELLRSDLVGQGSTAPLPLPNIAGSPLHTPTVSAAAYLRAGPIEDTIRSQDSGRFLSLAAGLVNHRGYLIRQGPSDWSLLVNQRGMALGLEDVQGYNSIQLQRYWRFVRAVSPVKLDYNAGVFPRPPPVALDLLQMRWVVGSPDLPPLGGLTRVAGDEHWALYERDGSPPRASVLSAWQVVGGWSQALRDVVDPSFDPGDKVILEQDPGIGPSSSSGQGEGGTASYRSLGIQAASVVVDARAPSVVLIRIPFDQGWHASVDGHAAPLLPADYLIQGVAVRAGHHVIRLSYDDPSIGYGLLGSGMALLGLLGGALVLWRRRPRPERGAGPSASGEGRIEQ